MSKKTWTDERTETVKEGYKAVLAGEKTIEELAKELEVSPRSVIGKLVSEKVYVKAEKPKARAKVDEGPTKKEMLRDITKLGFDVEGFLPAKREAIVRLKNLVESIHKA